MKGQATSMHDFDKERIVRDVAELYQDNSEELGFVTRQEIRQRFEENGVRFTHRNGEVVAAMDYSHLKRKPFTKVYHTAISDNGTNEDRWHLLEVVIRESPWGVVRSKVPYDSSENMFWEEHGRLIRKEDGKKRPLNVWQVRDDSMKTAVDY